MKRNLNEMKIGIMLVVGLVCGTLLLTSCRKDISTDEFVMNSPESTTETETDKENNEPPSEIGMGTVSHGVNWAKNEKDYSFTYEGGVLEIPYSMTGTGIGTCQGFLVYVNGIPQPYMIKDTEEEYKYMHIIEGDENQEVNFTISFIPVTGKAGDKLKLYVCSITNPSFIPDRVNTFQYGHSHELLEWVTDITFQKNAEKMPKVNDSLCILKKVRNQRVEIDKKEKKYITDTMTLGTPDLDKEVYGYLKIDGKSVRMDTEADISGKDKVHVSYFMMGHPGVKYRVNFYLNHQLLTDESGEVYELELATGKMNTLEFDMDVSKVTNASFYAVAVPVNPEDYPDDNIVTEKHPSINLYRGED